MKMTVTEAWTELPIKRGTVQAVGGYLEVENGATAPVSTNTGLEIEPNEKLLIDSLEKVWVRAVGTDVTGQQRTTCLYGGF